jgi:hypothetical protein
MTQDRKDGFRSLVRESLFAAVVDPIVALAPRRKGFEP